MSAPALRPAEVVELYDGIVEGPEWPLVPDGTYLAAYLDHKVMEIRRFKDSPKLFLRLRLVEAGEHTGTVLHRFYRVKRRIDGKRFVLGRRSKLMKTLSTVLDVPARPDRISLMDLKRHLLRITTRTVMKDADQRELPPSLRYSVVDEIIGRETS